MSLIAGFSSAAVMAGPPLATDDAGVLSQGGWEYTLAYEAETRDSGDSASAPSLEVAYGFSDSFQASISVGRAVVDEPGVDSRSDFDAIGAEAKWQFYAKDNVAIALAPSYSLPHKWSRDRGIVDNLRVLGLPIIASWESGGWTTDAQLGYDVTSSGPNSWFAGIAGGYQATDSIKLLAEVYRTKSSGKDDEETSWTVGFDLAVGEGLALLGSFGGSLESDLDSSEELDQTFYLGVRYETN